MLNSLQHAEQPRVVVSLTFETQVIKDIKTVPFEVTSDHRLPVEGPSGQPVPWAAITFEDYRTVLAWQHHRTRPTTANPDLALACVGSEGVAPSCAHTRRGPRRHARASRKNHLALPVRRNNQFERQSCSPMSIRSRQHQQLPWPLQRWGPALGAIGAAAWGGHLTGDTPIGLAHSLTGPRGADHAVWRVGGSNAGRRAPVSPVPSAA